MARHAGLIFTLFLAWLCFTPSPAHADTYGQAQAKCAAKVASDMATGYWVSMSCADRDNPPSVVEVGCGKAQYGGACYTVSSPYASFYYSGSKCSGLAPYAGSYGDNIAVCRGGCMYEPQPGGTTDTVSSGSWFAQLRQTMYAPTGETCAAGYPPEPPQASPTLCGGGSCHDTAAGKYCAVDSSGVQVCVSDSTPPSGGCASSGDTTLCVGNPPPAPPNPPIADPATGIASSDTYGHQEGNGGITSTTVNNYNNTNSPASNGAPSGAQAPAPDSGASGQPAPPSSSGAPHSGTASGGGDCNTPPICSGDQPTCAVVSQVWLQRCRGDGVASNDGDTTVPGLDGLSNNAPSGLFSDVSVLDKLDSSGFGGGGQCPRMPAIKIPMFNVDYEADWPQWCEILGMAGNVILLLAGFIALRILSE